MRTIRMVLAYDGTGLIGWQRQGSGPSVQGLLEAALSRIEGSSVSVAGAGRTDSGVHAVGQVASAQVSLTLDAATLRRALNAVLPPSIRVLRVGDVAPDFHARLSARSKTYEYRIVNGPVVSPFWSRYAWHVPVGLDAGRMDQAARLLAGTHDFAAFRSAGTDVRSTVRTLLHSSVTRHLLPSGEATSWGVPEALLDEGTLLTYVVTGTGFLRHMVRAIVGTLVQIGAGRSEVACVETLLATGRREDAGPTASRVRVVPESSGLLRCDGCWVLGPVVLGAGSCVPGRELGAESSLVPVLGAVRAFVRFGGRGHGTWHLGRTQDSGPQDRAPGSPSASEARLRLIVNSLYNHGLLLRAVLHVP